MDYVNTLETRLSKEKEGISVLPGVIDLLDSIPTKDWTINTANTYFMASIRLNQFNISVPKKMMTGCKVM
jgi:glycerol 3-phosphatase-1/sugar-phosphatase